MFRCGEQERDGSTAGPAADGAAQTHFGLRVERELMQLLQSAARPDLPPSSIAPALRRILVERAGGSPSRVERRRFYWFVAPIARRVVLRHARSIAGSEERTEVLDQVERWLLRLQSFDPLDALMVDLRYFAGLSLREIGEITDVSRETVVRDLRFAKAWLAAYLGHSPRR